MWFVITAVGITLLLFWKRVSFPVVEEKNVSSYSIIIPARNEENNLKTLLPSIISGGHEQGEVIVVDDHSEDGTREAAEAYGVKVISNPPLPEDWMGKSWACYNGAKEATGKSLLFLDADTWFSTNGPKKLIRYLEMKGEDALITVHPFHFMHSFWEKLSAVFHLVVFASSGITTIFRDQAGTRGGFGPCLLVNANTYWNLGGHHPIRSEVVEHLAMARRAEANGVRTYAFSGRNVVNMRMYAASFKAVAEGWSKSFASGAKTASPLMTLANIAWISVVISYIVNIQGTGWWGVIGYLFLAFWLNRILKDIGNFSFYDALLFPLHFIFFALIFAYSLLKTFLFKQSTWKGREITGKKKKEKPRS
ncbi:glycosyltransferase family 2 protein [Halobacillus sp. A5]|uniref:glycosyltransferase n=1 Tax=Halobacillus sp. A5 TaxID=2880263 RepID=UPI0020A69BC8|nr:glycosyltransferase family 2 protein [Halobacillus sp. A5]MCP3027358.1 glycosyltransferase [Halobacillus sp. A5]